MTHEILSGYRVRCSIAMADVWAQRLGDLGADVVKMARDGRWQRHGAARGARQQDNVSWLSLNQQKIVEVNLKSPRQGGDSGTGQDRRRILQKLPAGVAARLGIDTRPCQRINRVS